MVVLGLNAHRITNSYFLVNIQGFIFIDNFYFNFAKAIFGNFRKNFIFYK